MIRLTRFNGEEFVINCDMIEMIERTPDTVITLTNGHKFIAKESVDEVIDEVVKFKRSIFSLAIDRRKEV